MRFDRTWWHWYDMVFLGLAAIVVYPDEVLDWMSERTGKAFGWGHLLLLEVLSLAAMAAAMVLFRPAFYWWYPLLFIGGLAALRALHWFYAKLFGFRDW